MGINRIDVASSGPIEGGRGAIILILVVLIIIAVVAIIQMKKK